MKIYGIKTCGSVRKAIKFMNDNNIEFDFVDLKKEKVECDKIGSWLKKVSIDTLFNNKGTKYRTLGLKEFNLDDTGKKQWLCDENMLLKRPVIEYGNDEVMVAFDEEVYKETFL